MRKSHPVLVKAMNGNLAATLARQRRLIVQESERDRQSNSLEELAPDLGNIHTGRLSPVTAADPTAVDANGAFFDADGVEFSDGNTYHVGGVNNGQLMFGLRAQDGAGIFAGGQGVIDNSGINLNGIRYALRHYATDPDGDNPRYGAFEMFYPDGATVPALRLRYSDGAESAELATNGDFETGDATGWTATVTGASTFTVLELAGVGHQGILYRAAGQSGSVVNDAFAAAPGEHYRVRLTARGTADTAVTITGRVDWYDDSDDLISSSTVLQVSKAASYADTGINTINTSVTAPAGTATGQVYFTVSAGGTLVIDDVSVQAVSIDNSLVFDDYGFTVLRWDGFGSNGPGKHDRSGANSFTAQIMVLRAMYPMKITKFNWDIRNTGSYELRLLWSPNAANSMRTLWTGSAAVGVNEISLAEPEILLPGLHYFGLVRSGATTWWDVNAATYTHGQGAIPPLPQPAYRLEGIYYDTTGYNYVPAVLITFSTGRWS